MTNGRRGSSATVSAAVALLLGGGLAVVGVARAQGAAGTAHPVHVHNGTCDELGEIVAPLKDVTAVGDGPAEGAAGAAPVAQSVSEIAVPLADLLAAPHAVNVHDSAANIGEYVACGEIGGVVVDGTLAIGLREIGGSDLSGVALLASDPNDDTDVTIYLMDEGAAAGREAAAAPPAATAPAAAAAPEPTAEPTAVPPAPTAEPAAPAAAAAEVTVDIRDFSFSPNPVEVPVGGAVTWVNRDPVPHTATATDRGVLQSGLIPPDGGSFTQTFATAGEFPYFCEFHPNMTGTIVVR